MLLAMSSKPNVWRSRIVGHDQVDPESLVANPHNFRKHPLEQRDALSAAISEVGFVRSVTVNKTTGSATSSPAGCVTVSVTGETWTMRTLASTTVPWRKAGG